MIDRKIYPQKKEISAKIAMWREKGNLAEAIELCQDAASNYAQDYFFPKILGDLYFQQENYIAASQAYLEYLKRIPPNGLQFGQFAKRYYRLRRIWSSNELANYAQSIMAEIEKKIIHEENVQRVKTLVKYDLKKQIQISPDGYALIDFINNDTNFKKFIDLTKKLEIDNPIELEYLLNLHALNRKRSETTFRIDTHIISLYEKFEGYKEALKIATELTNIRIDSVVIRSIFRICRKIDSYETADKLLSQHPKILRASDFNILYELIYYFENKNNLEQIQFLLNTMEKNGLESIPIQKTVKNFYLRFGLLEDVTRVDNHLAQIISANPRKQTRFLSEVKESEIGLGSKIKDLYAELDHQTRLAAISDLTTGISHELGQPITNIRYTIQFYQKLFEQKMDKEDVFKVFDSILEETQRMGGLIKRLSPLTSSKNVIEQFNVVDHIRKRIQAEMIRLKQSSISIKISSPTPIIIESDPVKFDQLINNLLLNSIDAINENKPHKRKLIDIKVRERGENIEIVFRDTGIGIPTKYRGKILDPFFTTKDPGKGEGLGLFIVWDILKMQGGKLTLDPKYHSGVRFIITMPKTVNKVDEVK